MFCKDCPCVSEEFERRMEFTQEPENAEMYCWCEKLGTKLWYGTCEDGKLLCIENQTPKKIISNKRKPTNKQERKDKEKYKLQQISKLYQGAYPVDAKFIKIRKDKYVHADIPNYKTFYRPKRIRYAYFKKYSNKIIRYYDGEISNGSHYKRISDFWQKVN